VPETAASDPAVRGVLKRPFAEQVAFFRGKLGTLVPTERWTDMMHAAHDRAFMVAGAQNADLLAGLAASVDRAITEGTGIDQFRKDFDALVERHGWSHTGSRDWRTRVIYTTNIASSYSAGRLAQLREGGFPFWVYVHSDSVITPRPLHESWHGVTLPASHEWWLTHFTPNGWGCKCRIVGVRKPEDAARYGKVQREAPDNGIDAKTGTPAGIDKGWVYMPGDTVSDTVRALSQKLEELPPPLAVAVMKDWLAAQAFARWFESPRNLWPLARIPDADARAIGSQKTIAKLSAETAAKQLRTHPELAPREYVAAQDVIDHATGKAQDGARAMIYVRELSDAATGGHVLVVKATLTGEELFITSFRRLSRDQATRDREVRRLLGKGGG